MTVLPEVSQIRELEKAPAPELLEWAIRQFGNSLGIATAFQAEGMVILDMAARVSPALRVFTLDTGRLPEETYRMIETVRERYGVQVETVSPDATEVEEMIKRHGPNLFYREVPLRSLCCHLRKVRPLERKLKEFRAWVVGLRRDQNESRADVRKIDTGALPAGIETVLRFHPRCPFGPGTRYPCLLALMRDGVADTPTGIQRIALTPEVAPAAGGGSRTPIKNAASISLPKEKANAHSTCW